MTQTDRREQLNQSPRSARIVDAVPDVEFVETIGLGTHSIVHRVRHGERDLALKIQRRTERDEAEAVRRRFRREAALLASLEHPAFAEIYTIDEVDGIPYILMEYARGETLEQRLGDGPMSVNATLPWAIRLAEALDTVHRRGLVHRDVQPANILFASDGTARLIDFELAFARYVDDAQHGVGTLRYSAPEQFGLIERPVDGRADLYAFGAVLFECLAGRPPFEADTPKELIRHHTAVEVPSLQEVADGVPTALAQMVERLLAKDPDDRYQSAAGLASDLERFDDAPPDERASCPLGIDDYELARRPTGPFVGRDNQLRQLRECWQETEPETGRLAVVRGKAGSGKSHLVRAFLADLDRSTPVLEGKASREDARPFTLLRSAVDDWVQALDRHPEPLRTRHLEQLRSHVDASAKAAMRLFPRLSNVLDLASPSADSTPPEQFYEVVAEFFTAVAEATSGVVLHVDNLQWVDAASWQVLRRLARRLDDAHVMLVTTCRIEGEHAERGEQLLEESDTSRSLQIEVDPLSRSEVDELVDAYLGTETWPDELAEQLMAYSAGSPFLIVDCLFTMLDAGLVEPSWDGWSFDAERTERLDFSDEALSFVEQRVDRLDDRTRKIVSVAAVLVDRFDPSLLAEVSGADLGDIHRAIGRATTARVLERASSSAYTFVHDRLREALLERIDDEQRRRWHQRAAETLDDREKSQSVDVYELARHYRRGECDRTPDRVIETNVRAGRRAASEYAHRDAYHLLSFAYNFATQRDREASLDLHAQLGKSAARASHLEEAIEHVQAAIEQVDDPVREAELRSSLSQIHQWNSMEAASMAEQIHAAFETLDHSIPSTLPGMLLSTIWWWLLGLAVRTTGFGYGTAEGESEARFAVLASLHRQAMHANLWTYDIEWMVLYSLRSSYSAHRLGDSAQLVRHYATVGTVFSGLGLELPTDWYGESAIETAEQLGDREPSAFARLRRTWQHHHLGRVRTGAEREWELLEEQGHWLTSGDFSMGCTEIGWNFNLRGYCHRALHWLEKARDRFQHPGARDAPIFVLIPCAVGYAQLGRLDRARRRLGEAEALLTDGDVNPYHRATLLAGRMTLHLEAGEIEAGLEVIEAHRELELDPATVNLQVRDFYVTSGYFLLEEAVHARKDERRERMIERLDEALEALERAALHHGGLQAHYRVLDGGRHALDEEDDAARSSWQRAETLARDDDLPWVQYEVHRRRARLLRRRGFEDRAADEAGLAAELARRHDWRLRRRRVREEFADIVQFSEASRREAGPTSSDTQSAPLRLQTYFDTLLQVSMAASGERQPDDQIRAVVEEIVSILGAERGMLFLIDEDRGQLEMSVAIDAEGEALEVGDTYSHTAVERVLETGEPFVMSGNEHGDQLAFESVVAHDIRSIAAAPLSSRDRDVGVLYVDSRLAQGVFSEDDLEILLALANHIPVALETIRNAQLEVEVESERRQRQLAESLREMTADMNATLEIPAILEHLIEGCISHIGVDAAMATTLDGSGEIEHVVEARIEEEKPRYGEGDDPNALSIDDIEWLPEVLDTAEPRRLSGVAPRRHPFSTLEPESLLSVPFTSRGAVVGVLLLARETEPAFEDNHLDLAATFARQAGIAVENARLATYDELTDIYNRRHFLRLARREFERCRRYDESITAIMMDIDHFGELNDTYGHAAGDAVLRELAAFCDDSIRSVDVMGRYGGEEFAFVLPNTARDGEAEQLAERLRRTIEQHDFEWEDGTLNVTASLGIADDTDTDDPDLQALIEIADTRLYEAKERGRNRVVSE